VEKGGGGGASAKRAKTEGKAGAKPKAPAAAKGKGAAGASGNAKEAAKKPVGGACMDEIMHGCQASGRSLPWLLVMDTTSEGLVKLPPEQPLLPPF
jgi:hypothetical protein